MSIGSMIYKYRTGNNYTQQDMEDYLSVQPQTISRWETGNGNPDIYLIPKIAEFLHVSLDDLFEVNLKKTMEHAVAEASFQRTPKTFQNAFDEIIKVEASAKASNDQELLKKVYGEKMHTYLQLQWYANGESIEACKEWIKLSSDDMKESMNARMQLLQLESISTKGRLKNCRKYKSEFETNPSFESLQLYFYALFLHDDTEHILELWKQLENTKYMKVTNESSELFSLFLKYAIEHKLNEFVDLYYPSFLEIASENDLYSLHWAMLNNHYGDKEQIKELLLKEAKCFESDEEWYRKAIETITNYN